MRPFAENLCLDAAITDRALRPHSHRRHTRRHGRQSAVQHRDLRKRVNRTPGTFLALGIGKHAVGGFVGASVIAVLAGDRLVVPMASITPAPPCVQL